MLWTLVLDICMLEGKTLMVVEVYPSNQLQRDHRRSVSPNSGSVMEPPFFASDSSILGIPVEKPHNTF